MDLGVSHLSQDAGPSMQLDVKQLIESRKRNAREDRAMRYRSRILERAHQVNQKNSEHELRMLRSSLIDLGAVTPYLNSFSPRGPSATKASRKPHLEVLEMRRSKHKVHVKIDKEQFTNTYQKLPKLKLKARQRTKSNKSVTSLPSVQQSDDVESSDRLPSLDHCSLATGTSISGQSSIDTSDSEKKLKFSTKNNIRKSRYVANTLQRLYNNRQMRKKAREVPTPVELPVVDTMQRAHLILQSSFGYAAKMQDDAGSVEDDLSDSFVGLSHTEQTKSVLLV